MERYSWSKESAKSLATLLESGEPGDYYQDHHYNLLGAAIFQVIKAVPALQGAIPGPEGEEQGLTDLPQVAALEKLSREVELSCHKSCQRAQNRTLVPSDRPLLTVLYDAGDQNTISENDSKGISGFNNVGSDIELN